MGLWADMLALLPAAIPRLPRDVIAYDWYYHPFGRHPRVELHNFAEVDLAAPLQARGIEYWGCPMNGAFRYEPLPVFGERMANIVSWWRRCRRVGAGGFLVTSWEANRLAIELTIAIDAAAACLWLDPEITDPPAMLRRGFERVFGPHRGAAAARIAADADKHPYAGSHRWQINERWDVCAGRDEAGPYEKELRALVKIRSTGPSPLTASLALRRYLARRDVFVRRAAHGVFQLRRALVSLRSTAPGGIGRSRPTTLGLNIVGRGLLPPPHQPSIRAVIASLRTEATALAKALDSGRAAARAMWNRSRDPRHAGPTN